MSNCTDNGGCSPMPSMTIPDCTSTSQPVERVREVIMVQDPCCTVDEQTDAGEGGVTVSLCDGIVIENGLVKSWPAMTPPILLVDSRNGDLIVDQRGCEVDLSLGDAGITKDFCNYLAIQRGVITALTRFVGSITFDENTCLEVKGYDAATCSLRVGLREGCAALGGTGSGATNSGSFGSGDGTLGYVPGTDGTIVYQHPAIGCACSQGEAAQIKWYIEELPGTDGNNTYRVGRDGLYNSGASSDLIISNDPTGGIYSSRSLATDAIVNSSCVGCIDATGTA
ncbi:MAG: hypothetical protein R3E87_07380 [Burkholderiaceae bacterium]